MRKRQNTRQTSKQGSRTPRRERWSDLEARMRGQIDIVEVISGYIDLDKVGDHYEGKCPFHAEGTTKTIHVYPGRRIFICMSRGCANGDVFDFVSKKEGVNRAEAIRLLAKKAGVPGVLIEASQDDQQTLTYSMLKVFQQCPLRYKYRYIEGRPDERTLFYLAIGRSVHAALAHFFKDQDPRKRTLEHMLLALDEHWLRTGFSEKESERHWLNLCKEMLTNYYRGHDCSVRTIMIEANFRCQVNGLVLAGRLDRVDRLSDGSHEVIDYKVGHEDSPWQDKEDDVQLVFYYYGATRGLGLPVSKLTYQYLAADQTITFTVDENVMSSKLPQLSNLANILKSTTEFVPRQNRFCVDCLVSPMCPELKKG